jgi:hypothetical protein
MKKRKILPLQGIELRPSSQYTVDILTEVSRLPYTTFLIYKTLLEFLDAKEPGGTPHLL